MAGRSGKRKILNRYLVISGVAAALLGCFLAWYYYVAAPPETALTDSELAAARRELEDSAARMDEIIVRVRREVTGIRGEFTKKVEALPPDGVARGLNDELARFRRMGVRAEGVDDPPARILGRE